MRFARSRTRTLGALAAVGLGVSALAACMPADGTSQTLAAAGSDTTENVMDAITADYNGGPNSNINSDPDNVVNILSREFSPKVVPGDAECGTITYHTPAGPGEVLAPNGSSNGRNALKASVQAGDGCIDIARSSGTPRAIGSDLATFEYYAFGLDAMGWTSASTLAPANLSQAQLQGIYNCTFTNWNQVGGSAGPIERYVPQTGSGTYQFFTGNVLGFDPALFSGPGCPAIQFTQENSGEAVALNGDQQSGIIGYSAGNWVAQARGTAPDQRFGQQIKQLNGQNIVVSPGGTPQLNTAGPVNENNVELVNPTPAFPGIRMVFNVIDSTHVNYGQVRRLVGFMNQAPGSGVSASPLCNDKMTSTIESFGFGALDRTTSASNLQGSTCRFFTP